MPEQVVHQKSRGFICVNAHPAGCAKNVADQTAVVRKELSTGPNAPNVNPPKNVLVIGSSTGYGLSSRIASAWGFGAKTLGVFFEKEPAGKRTATAGYYNTAAFHRAAERDGLWARSLNGDAYSDEIKDQVSKIARDELGKFDLVIYSLASPKRTDPRSGETYGSALKSIGEPYTGKTIDLSNGNVTEATIEPASADEIEQTTKVMGGEDWQWWIDKLLSDGLLADGARTLAYSYVGPEVTWPIYHHGTIGAAKKHLQQTAAALSAKLADSVGGAAWVSVNKAVVTQASAAIPVVPLYISLLFRVMKQKGIHEGCIEQISRLFRDHLAADSGPQTDHDGLIRLDDWEMRADVQAEIAELWPRITTDNLDALSDYQGLKSEFSKLFGFGVDGVDYDRAVETEIPI